MGDPRHLKKKYSGPTHPWQADRIALEKELVKEYGLVKKKELWKANTILKNYKKQAKAAIVLTTEQGDKEREALIRKLQRYGLISENAAMDDILGLSVKAVLERRLQTLVVRKGLARTMKQARQLVLHGHITVGGRKVTAPSYMVPVDEENTISFAKNSPLASEDHPEREKIEGKNKEQEASSAPATEEASADKEESEAESSKESESSEKDNQ
ncbi:30S ribosomal protein S4 [Candidatus Woesearchaeota archaeon]|nr:MAG: 30S ribosomal protein S4 [Candidatus Woesearchaeota archaeon]